MSDRKQHAMGRTTGQGLAGVSDDERRDLLDRGGDPRTRDERDVRSSADRTDESGQAKDDPGRAPESGAP